MLRNFRHACLITGGALLIAALAYWMRDAEASSDKRQPAPEATYFDGTGVRPVDGIMPASVRLSGGKDGDRCLQVVEIVDSARACQAYQCVKTFPSRQNQKLIPGQRALLADVCRAAGMRQKPSLLWGSDSVLILQPERHGAGLWTPMHVGQQSIVQLETEMSFGTLAWSHARFIWNESPD